MSKTTVNEAPGASMVETPPRLPRRNPCPGGMSLQKSTICPGVQVSAGEGLGDAWDQAGSAMASVSVAETPAATSAAMLRLRAVWLVDVTTTSFLGENAMLWRIVWRGSRRRAQHVRRH